MLHCLNGLLMNMNSFSRWIKFLKVKWWLKDYIAGLIWYLGFMQADSTLSKPITFLKSIFILKDTLSINCRMTRLPSHFLNNLVKFQFLYSQKIIIHRKYKLITSIKLPILQFKYSSSFLIRFKNLERFYRFFSIRGLHLFYYKNN